MSGMSSTSEGVQLKCDTLSLNVKFCSTSEARYPFKRTGAVKMRHLVAPVRMCRGGGGCTFSIDWPVLVSQPKISAMF